MHHPTLPTRHRLYVLEDRETGDIADRATLTAREVTQLNNELRDAQSPRRWCLDSSERDQHPHAGRWPG